jgi:hypothetical protein
MRNRYGSKVSSICFLRIDARFGQQIRRDFIPSPRKVRAIEAETGLLKSLSASVSLAGVDPGRKATK